MTLQRIELAGFKSFAARTVLDFDHHLVAIVGPNGSGKSNVADAVRWVLGEQNPRLLRGKRAEDVIFAGSVSRQPLGMAEVSIVLDNTSGRLPIDYQEVRISRRLYRSGESEYLINGSRARLRDVSELLMRVGLGPDSYSVIGQGAIDEMILQHPEERRILLENAADVRRYRVQIAETASKLSSVEQNLARSRDIQAELEPLARRLRQQAERAERHQAVQQELERVSAAWFRHRFALAEQGLQASEEALTVADAELRALESALARAELERREHERALEALAARLDSAQAEAVAAEREEHRLQRLDAETRAALAGLAARTEQLRGEGERTRARLEELSEALCAADDEARRAEQVEREAAAGLQALEAAQRERQLALVERRREAEAADAAVAQLDGSLAALQRQLTEAQRLRADHQRRALELAARLSERHKQAGEDDIALQALATTAAQAEQVQHLAQEQQRAADARAVAAEAALRAARERLRALEARRQELHARVQALSELEALPDADGALALHRIQPQDEAFPLGSRLVVQPGAEAAVAAALGAALGALVLDHDTAWQALEWLGARPAGRALLVLQPLPAEQHGEAGQCPVAGLARRVSPAAVPLADLVQVDESLAPLAQRLLRGAVLAPDLAAARRIAAALWQDPRLASRAWAVVTPRGEAIFASGLARGGRDASAEARAARGRERLAALEHLTAAEAECAQAAEAVRCAEARHEEAQRQVQAAVARLAAATTEARLAQQRLDEAQSRVRARRGDLEVLAAQAAESEHRAQEAEHRGRDLAERLEALRRKRATAAAVQDRALRAVARAREALEQAGPGLIEARSALARAAAVRQASQEQAARLRRELERAQAQFAQVQSELDAAERALGQERHTHENEIAALAQRRLAASAEVEALRQERAALQQRLAATRQTVAEQRAQLDGARQQREAAALATHRARDELERLARDLAELADDETILELGDRPRQLRLRLDELAADAAELPVGRDPAWLRKRMLQLQRELRAIGQVNPGVVDEYREVSERLAFLREQSADLERAMAELRRAMADLEALAAERLRETFSAVNAAFQEAFTALFGGGSASLVLSEPDTPLEGGVEVVARPPGKRAQPLAALSGGERSLTMLALLLALLKVSPTPFCILDEVDAALDDANVQRFVKMLQGYGEQTRFVLVTHNRATMEHADRLFGVTMDASGVSKVVTVMLPAASPNGQAASAALAEVG